MPYTQYSFEEHLAKETQFADQIGKVFPYLSGEKNLEDLKRQDPDLYKKLRDNPERIALLSSLPHGKLCIDVGCSDGLIDIEIAKKSDGKIMGIDIRPLAIENAKRLLELAPHVARSRVVFRVSTPEEVVATGSQFDTVYFCEVLEHIEGSEHDAVLKTLCSLMNLKGNLIISVPNRYPAQHYVNEGRDRWDAPAHRFYFSKDIFENLLKKYFNTVEFISLFDNELPENGIWLIANCFGKKI